MNRANVTPLGNSNGATDLEGAFDAARALVIEMVENQSVDAAKSLQTSYAALMEKIHNVSQRKRKS